MTVDAGTRRLPTPLRTVLGEVTRFDRSAFAPLAGLRVAVAVTAALVIGLAARNPGGAASMAAGALLVGLPTAVGGRRIAVSGLALITASMAISTFVGSATGDLGWVHTAILVPWCLAGGLLLALQNPYLSAGTQGIAAMIVFGRFAEAPLGALELAAYVLAGGVIAIVVLAATRAPLTSRAERRGLATAMSALADLARAGPGRRNGIASAEALDEAEALLDRAVERSGTDALRALLDVARRSRLELLAIDGLQRRLLRQDAAADLLAAAEDALAAIADAIDAISRHVPTAAPAHPAAILDERLRTVRHRLHSAATDSRRPPSVAAVAGALEDHLVALAAQVRAVAELAARPGDPGRRAPLPADPSVRARRRHEHWQDALDTLRAHATLRSPIGRHAVRLAAVVTIAEVIALRTPLARGYWVALTASVVLRPEFSVTFSRGLARLVGTSLGVLLAGLLAVAVHPDSAIGVVAIAVLCTAACGSFQVSYALFSGFLTGLVVLLVGVVGAGTLSTAFERLLDTAIGGALALGAYALWPTWSRVTASVALAGLARDQQAYLDAVLRVITGRRRLDPTELRLLAREARTARAEAEAVVARAAAEPAGRGIDIPRARGVLAALGRISLTTHGLRLDIEADRPPRTFPEAVPLADALVAGLGTISDTLVHTWAPGTASRLAALAAARLGLPGEDPGPPFPALRRFHDSLDGTIDGDPWGARLLADTDELVDAVDTAAALLGALPTAGVA